MQINNAYSWNEWLQMRVDEEWALLRQAFLDFVTDNVPGLNAANPTTYDHEDVLNDLYMYAGGFPTTGMTVTEYRAHLFSLFTASGNETGVSGVPECPNNCVGAPTDVFDAW